MGIEKYKLSMTSPEVDAALQRAASGGALDQQLQRKVNPNLLDNWYFGNPVNQRGQTEYTGLTYCIDRWKLQYVTQLAIVDGGVKLTGYWDITEYFENMPAGTYTLSLLYKDSSSTDLHADINEASGNLIKRAITTQLSGLMSVTTTTDKLGGVAIGFLGGAENSVTLIAAKLELGDTQTLAHKEGDEWVLNEIPNKAEQFAICSQYEPDTGELLGGWEHPPMQLGVEYRTTERYLGKPVYATLFNCGVGPAANTTKTVEHNLKNVGCIVSCNAVLTVNNAQALTLPYYISANNQGYCQAAYNNIKITSIGVDLSGYNICYALVKYTKTTD